MKNKVIEIANRAGRFGKALAVESTKRLPWVILLLVLLITFQNVQDSKTRNQNQTVLLEKIASLSEDNKKLSQENRTLGQQVVYLSNRSAQQIDCVKQLFVDYINTGQGISSVDSDACTVNVDESSNTSTTTQSNTTTPQSTQTVNKPEKAKGQGFINRFLHFIRIKR